MPKWENQYSDPPSSLSIVEGHIVLRQGEETQEIDPEAIQQDRELQTELERLFNSEELTQAIAWLRHRDHLSPEIRERWSHSTGRPRLKRVWSQRGSYVIWIRGRNITSRFHDVEPDYEADFDSFLESDGLPQPYKDIVGEETAQKLLAGIKALNPLDCFCWTGAETSGEQGQLRTLYSRQAAFAMVDDRTSICQCQVCARIWSFRESGDSHYSYHYSVSPFDPWK